MFLDTSEFSQIIKNTPLISIDLIVKNNQNEVLLGKRSNNPAKGFWFTPGGRIYKDESIEDAFRRISKDELGTKFNISDAKFLGVFQHFYDDNVFNNKFSTHYIVLAFEIETSKKLGLDRIQHLGQKWFKKDTLNSSDLVHKYVKDYFIIKGGKVK